MNKTRYYCAIFEYRGRKPTTIIGLGTGTHYEFRESGDRIAVPLQDRQSLARVPALRQIVE